VWAWGDVDFGSFDDLGYDKVHLVRQIPELSGIIEIAAGDSHSMALKNDGTLWVWGMNKSGQLGNGGADMFYPVQVIR
ncbi:MAG TPA: RCC1 repeat-containing protein, partial [Bacillota bacterium]|nr:RCC1 repeat-containing protein [Bacillota bacterium]